ncbi:MAG: hypothetical protein JSV86_10880 [Gemmatimonadota bacterium]|nr:MAG: hypothetical protein JSV86_10880 [Gemmatimonadota bacterium]
MYRILSVSVLVASLLVLLPDAASGQHMGHADKEAKIENALSAAPAAIADGAAVVDWDNTQLRRGTNGWTCMPGPPHLPGNAPMCLDEQWVKWAMAWTNHEEPQITQIGLAYMLEGGVDASNTDPYASEPAPGDDWVHSGPHVMIVVPDLAALEALPTDPNSGGPYVMWKGTPYAHIMMPIAEGQHGHH